jgi:hypothetical protein
VPRVRADHSSQVAKGLPTAECYSLIPKIGLGGGRTWWAHFELAGINTAPTFLHKTIEDVHEVDTWIARGSALPQCDDGLDHHGVSRWDIACGERDRRQHQRDSHECQRIGGGHAKQQTRARAPELPSPHEPEPETSQT